MLHYFDRLVFHSSFPEQLACPSDPVVLPLPNARVVANETCRFFCSCWHFMCCWKPARCFLLSNLNSFDMQHVVCCYRNRRHHIVQPYPTWSELDGTCFGKSIFISICGCFFPQVALGIPMTAAYGALRGWIWCGYPVANGENGGLHEVTKTPWFLHKTLLVNSK